MKKILTLILIISLFLNIFLFLKIKNNNFESKKNNTKKIISCETMYWDYYVNTPKDLVLDFWEDYVKECLKNDFWKEYYILNGFTYRVMEDMKKYKEKNWLSNFYINLLKQKFLLIKKLKKEKLDWIDYWAINIALELINDKKFKNSKLIKNILKEEKESFYN